MNLKLKLGFYLGLGILILGFTTIMVGCNTATTAASATTTTTSTTTSSTTTTIPTSGTVTLNYIGNPTEEGHSFVFETATASYEGIFSFTGDIINVGSLLWTPATTEGAGIIDMGAAELSAITSAPASGYSTSFDGTVGNVACVKTTAGKYAKIRVSSYESNSPANTTDYTFDWVFQTNGTRNF